jgi:hypothetical protein
MAVLRALVVAVLACFPAGALGDIAISTPTSDGCEDARDPLYMGWWNRGNMRSTRTKKIVMVPTFINTGAWMLKVFYNS